MQALILCGGLGTRLRSVVHDAPKTMAPIRGTPFLEIVLGTLSRMGVREVVLATGYKADQIEAHFGNGDRWGLSISYSREPSPLGTAGAIKLAEGRLAERVLILNGDTFATFELARLEALLDRPRAELAMALKQVEEVARYGSVLLEPDGRVHAFKEKGDGHGPGTINAGVYLLRRDLLAEVPAGRPVSLEREILPKLLERGAIYGCEMAGPFIDIGVPEDYARAQSLLAGDATC